MQMRKMISDTFHIEVSNNYNYNNYLHYLSLIIIKLYSVNNKISYNEKMKTRLS